MSSLRSSRAWIPAALAPVALVVLLFLAWGVNKAVNDGASSPRPDASFLRWLAATNNTFFGTDPFSSGLGGRLVAGTVVSVVLLLVVGFLVGLVGVRGLAPGSSAVPAFLSLWMALVLACVVSGTADYLVVRSGQPGFQGEGRLTYSVVTGQLAYGAKFGWIAALFATLVWLLVRPRAEVVAAALPGAQSAEEEAALRDEFVLKRRTDFDPDFRPEPVPGAQPDDVLDPLSDPSSDAPVDPLADRRGDRSGTRADRAELQPADDSAPVVEEAPGDTYVGKYSTGRYAGPYAGGGDAAPSDEDPPASRRGGSHRADPNG